MLNKHTYTFNDMMRNTGKINHINSISSCGLVKLKKAHMKQEIVWSSDGSGFNGSEVPEDDVLCRWLVGHFIITSKNCCKITALILSKFEKKIQKKPFTAKN